MAIAVPEVSAATYPGGGGSTFSGSAEGWSGSSSCKLLSTVEVPLLCTASGGYDGTAGNPAGSYAARTEIPVNLVGVFKSEATAESPEFVAAASGPATVRLERSFDPGGLISLKPKLEYTATLIDKTGGMRQQAIDDTVTEASVFLPKEGAVSLVGGHSYVLQIVAKTDSTVTGVGLIGGETIARFDNVSVTGPGGGGGLGGEGGKGGPGGGGKSGGSGGVSSSRLEMLIQAGGLVGPAVLKGNRLSVKVKCPAKVGATCKDSLQGLIKKGTAATTARSAKIARGKTKTLVLKVKPKAKATVQGKKKLLFKLAVKAGRAHTTVYRSLKLIRR